LFPRRYVKKEEPYYDETLGKVNIITYLSLGNNGVFAVGTFPLPYSITDEGVLRKFYQETAKDFLNDEDYKISEVKEINLNGKPALEVSAESVKNKNEVAKIRVILSGKNVFYNLAILIIAENESPQDAVENRVKFEKETTNFFNSFAELPRAANSPAASIPPLFKSSFADGVFRSEHFDFTVNIPEDWIEISQTDVQGMRERGKDILKENSDANLSLASNARRNLFTFASKPLGAEKNAIITCNLTKTPSPSARLVELSNLTEQESRKVKFYTVTKGTHDIILGNTKFVGFEIRGTIAGEDYRQMTYFTERKDFALGFTMVYHDEEQRKILLELLSSMKFKQ